MSEPLYGAMQCEVVLHRHLIETWVRSLSAFGFGTVPFWIAEMHHEFGPRQEGYARLGRVLLLSWHITTEDETRKITGK